MKIYKKLLFALYFISFLTLEGLTQYQAQITQEAPDWLTKYWLYRWRFVNDFIKIGDQQGESLPVAERAANANPIFRWGDGTQKLGMYQCLLATEYLLLKNNNRLTQILTKNVDENSLDINFLYKEILVLKAENEKLKKEIEELKNKK